MKKLLSLIILLNSINSFAQDELIEFNFSQSKVIHQLNKSTGVLVGVITDMPNGICLYKMNLKSREQNNNVFIYERNDKEKGQNLYQRLEINLINNTANIFSSFRNISSTIPIEKRSCLAYQCVNINSFPPCS